MVTDDDQEEGAGCRAAPDFQSIAYAIPLQAATRLALERTSTARRKQANGFVGAVRLIAGSIQWAYLSEAVLAGLYWLASVNSRCQVESAGLRAAPDFQSIAYAIPL